MATSTTHQLSIGDLTIVDVDSHVSVGLDALLPYMDERHAAVKQLIEFADTPARQIYSTMRVTPEWFQTRKQEGFGERLVHEGDTTPAQKIELMDEFGIDYSILSTGPNSLASVNHDQTAVAIAEAYNSYLLDRFVDADDRIKANLIVPPQKPARGAAWRPRTTSSGSRFRALA